MHEFVGAAEPLTRADVDKAATILDVPEHVIWALRKVEANGKAFNKNGTPIIAFEPHVFYRQLPKRKRDEAMKARLAHPRWGAIRYKLRQSPRYEQLARAATIDRAAALKSCSWGAYQCMGFNHAACGFANVEQFVDAMKRSEGEQLFAIAKFIRSNKRMHAALKAGDWKTFAYFYNGPGHAKNSYVDKFRRWVAHFDGKKIKREVERVERAPRDVADANEAARETVRDGIGFTVYLTAFWGMIGDLRVAVDGAIEKMTGVQNMAPWVADSVLILTAVSAGLLVLNGIRTALRKKENRNVLDNAGA